MTVDVTTRDPEVGDRAHVCDLDVPTVSDAGVDHATTIVAGVVVGQYFRHGVPVAAAKYVQIALVHSACRVFQPRRRIG